MGHPKNRTGLKTFDKLAEDPRVTEIWDEGRDGYWVGLVDGYNFEGCSCVHEWTVKGVLRLFSSVEKGETY